MDAALSEAAWSNLLARYRRVTDPYRRYALRSLVRYWTPVPYLPAAFLLPPADPKDEQ